jgi:hypothetical protein
MIVTPISTLLESIVGKDSFAMSSTIVGRMDSFIDSIEQFAHEIWEDNAYQSGVLRMRNGHHTIISPPEIDLNTLVPCNVDMALEYLLKRRLMQNDYNIMNMTKVCNDNSSTTASCDVITEDTSPTCTLRNIITRNLLVKYAQSLDDTFDLATHPIILRNLWSKESFHDDSTSSRKLTPHAILNDPQLSSLLLPNYFSNAANKTGYAALLPDAPSITLSQFLQRLLSSQSSHAKIGTQVIINTYPELRDEIIPTIMAKELFGYNTHLDDIKLWMNNRGGWWLTSTVGLWVCNLIPPMTYFPVFIASNHNSHRGGVGQKDNEDRTTQQSHPRTDLHAEPIGNIASQLHGIRRWTLIPTLWSTLLRPTVSKHRGYFFSNMDPIVELPIRLRIIPTVYDCVTRRGDTIWIPPWVSVYTNLLPISLYKSSCIIEYHCSFFFPQTIRCGIV